MKIIADEDIPFVEHYFGHCGEIILKPGRTLTRKDLLEADILIARSVTQINQRLLEGTPVRFVGSTVTGIDHIDTEWLDQEGISWAYAGGCNAQAVADYVIGVIAALQSKQLLSAKKMRVGVVGVGHIGSRVVLRLKSLNVEVVQCDPIRADNESGFLTTSLSDFADLDLITLHTPLTRVGKHPTFHMIEKNFLQRQKENCILLNTGRGAVIHSGDLKTDGHHLKWCFDVWENEPTIDLDILKIALIATQHIAGHSIQGKYRGIEMIYQQACDMGVISKGEVVPVDYPRMTLSFSGKQSSWRDVVLKIFDPLQYTQTVKSDLLGSIKTFDQLRKEFVRRHEFSFVDIRDVILNAENKKILAGFGIN